MFLFGGVRLNWRKAKRRELYAVIFDDMATNLDIDAAIEELRRRMFKRNVRVNYKGKAVYPR